MEGRNQISYDDLEPPVGKSHDRKYERDEDYDDYEEDER